MHISANANAFSGSGQHGLGAMIRTRTGFQLEGDSGWARAQVKSPPGIDDVPVQDRAVVRFATFQLFSIIYLEKFAVGPPTFQVSVLLIVMLASLAWMVLIRSISFSAIRTGFYLIFAACSLLSQLIASKTSVPSLLDLLLLYGFMTASAPLSEAGYRRVLENFVKLMIVPAVIILIQYSFQKITGQGDPISMDQMLPKSMLMQGYVYEAHWPLWNSIFQRPNGFFFLEPSFASFFTASAAIIEMTYLRRPFYAILMILATALSSGGTGVTMFILASPFLLVRESPRIVIPAVTIAVVGLCTAYLMGAELPLVSRLNELDQSGIGAGYSSSGALRLTIPLNALITLLSDPSYLFSGAGAGSTGADFGNPWPILKLTRDYGVLTMVAFVFFFVSCFGGKHNIPFKISAAVIFNFTGGYLLDPALIIFFATIICIIEPVQAVSPKSILAPGAP